MIILRTLCLIAILLMVVNGNCWNLAQLVELSMEDSVVGITSREINSIKEKMDKAKNDLYIYRNEIDNNKCKLVVSLKEQIRLCKISDKCVQKLYVHLKICGNGKYKTMNMWKIGIANFI